MTRTGRARAAVAASRRRARPTQSGQESDDRRCAACSTIDDALRYLVSLQQRRSVQRRFAGARHQETLWLGAATCGASRAERIALDDPKVRVGLSGQA